MYKILAIIHVKTRNYVLKIKINIMNQWIKFSKKVQDLCELHETLQAWSVRTPGCQKSFTNIKISEEWIN